MSDFNSHSRGLTSAAFWRPIKSDSSPLSLAEGTRKAGKEQRSGMLKSSMMESVNSANGSLSPRCPVCFMSWRSRWQKVYWTLTVSPYKWFLSRWAVFVRGTGLDYQSNAVPAVHYQCELRRWGLSDGSARFVCRERPSLPRISSPFLQPLSSIRNYIGKFYLLRGCWQPWRTGKIQFNNLLLPTHLQAQRDLRAENTGWALAALWLLLDHFLSDR